MRSKNTNSIDVGVPLLVYVIIFFSIINFKNANAHDHWILPSNFNPNVGDTVEIYVRSGHHFPESEMALSDKIVHEVFVITPDNQKVNISTTIDDKERKGKYGVSQDGIHRILFTLKRKLSSEPNYYGMSYFSTKQSTDKKCDQVEYIKLKIIPRFDNGKINSFQSFYDNNPLSTTLNIYSDTGKNYSRITDKQGILKNPFESDGCYLITTSSSGITTSLTVKYEK